MLAFGQGQPPLSRKPNAGKRDWLADREIL
jgi:hypothetical protein